LPKAFVGDDGQLYKACPQCIKDEMAVFPTLDKEEATLRVTVLAEDNFCASSYTSDGFQPWCKAHVHEANKRRQQELDPAERERRKARQRENAKRHREALRAAASKKKASLEAPDDVGGLIPPPNE
jgi:hypothetical protein